MVESNHRSNAREEHRASNVSALPETEDAGPHEEGCACCFTQAQDLLGEGPISAYFRRCAEEDLRYYDGLRGLMFRNADFTGDEVCEITLLLSTLLRGTFR